MKKVDRENCFGCEERVYRRVITDLINSREKSHFYEVCGCSSSQEILLVL
jgi:hypothetical protein